MAGVHLGAALGHIHKLFGEGTLAGLPDARLLERYASWRDELAFEALVQRHGPMVMAVCRGILDDTNDVDDAFQATFLLLARKARSLWVNDSLGGWLHRVACRIALQAKADDARRRENERRAAQMAAGRRRSTAAWDDVSTVIHQEIDRLPERFRKPIVLCYLEEMTCQQAAGQLRWSEGTTRGRLARAKALLKARLTRRGVTLTGSGLGALSFAKGARAVSTPLIESTVRAARHYVLGEAATLGTVSTAAASLVKQAMRNMVITKLKMAGAAALLIGALLGCVASGLAVTGPAASHERHAWLRPVKTDAHFEPAKAGEAKTLTFRGRVLGPDGEPLPGAKLFRTPATGNLRRPYRAHEYATTGPDGRFRFAAGKGMELTITNEKYIFENTVIAAASANHGVAWLELPADGPTDDLTLQLVDDEPIAGQIVDLEGRPVAGATLQVLQIQAAAGEDLGPWLEAAKGTNGPRKTIEGRYLSRVTIALAPKATTDAAGRFRLTGIGRNRLVVAQLDGPTIVSQYLNILTRPGDAIDLATFQKPRTITTYYSASFRHPAAPTKPVVGVIRDKDTRKPLAGVTVESNKLANDPVPGQNIVQTTTDTEGRYRLTGLPKGEGNTIRVVPREDQPLVSVHALVPDSPGLDPVTVDFELKRGIWIEGKLTDKVTGKPVQGSVDYFALENNPNLLDHPGFDGTIPPYWGVRAKDDGSFRVVGLPGPGLIAVFYTDHHLLAPDRDDEYGYGIKEPVLYTSPRQLGLLINYTALGRIDPAKGADSVKRDLTLDPGWTFTGTVHGPDGKPRVGARSFGLTDRTGPNDAMKTAEFTVRAFNPRRPRDVFFQDPENGLVGVARPPKENGGSVTVPMEPGATITGRLVDADGKPRAGVELEVLFRHKANSFYFDWSTYSLGRLGTDAEGRFRITALLPGYEFRLSDGMGVLPFGGGALRPDETKDLGDVRIKGVKD